MRPGQVQPRFKAPRKRRERVAASETLAASKRVVERRSGGRCEARIAHRCSGRATQHHHVKRRSQGGSNAPENLLHVCTAAHLTIHAHPAAAVAAGDLAPSWTDR